MLEGKVVFDAFPEYEECVCTSKVTPSEMVSRFEVRCVQASKIVVEPGGCNSAKRGAAVQNRRLGAETGHDD
jgi:hypothetical protein